MWWCFSRINWIYGNLEDLEVDSRKTFVFLYAMEFPVFIVFNLLTLLGVQIDCDPWTLLAVDSWLLPAKFLYQARFCLIVLTVISNLKIMLNLKTFLNFKWPLKLLRVSDKNLRFSFINDFLFQKKLYCITYRAVIHLFHFFINLNIGDKG
jgi:hypothetical protein